jgi:hypothetical protein
MKTPPPEYLWIQRYAPCDAAFVRLIGLGVATLVDEIEEGSYSCKKPKIV